MPYAARKRALFALFLVPGLVMSSWTTRSPSIRDELGVSTAEMGLILFGLSVGAMLGILTSAPLVFRYSTRPVIGMAVTTVAISVPTIAAATAAGFGPGVAGGLALFGLGMGWGEVAMNIDCADVESNSGATVLPTMHGFFSLGTVIGAVVGIGATVGGFSAIWHLMVIGLVSACILIGAIGSLHPEVGRRPRSNGAHTHAHSNRRLWRDTRLLLIGIIVLAMAFAEGAANDWLPLVMVDGHGTSEVLGSVMYALFAGAVAAGRFAGGTFADRIGRAVVLRISALAACLGLVGVILFDDPKAAAGGVILWGVGISLGFPLALSAAGKSGPNPAARVALASMVGYIALLVGPPALGMLGEEFGLRNALFAVLIPVGLVVLIASWAEPPRTQTRDLPAELDNVH